jgi:uncharacterized protein (TIGR02466 family)
MTDLFSSHLFEQSNVGSNQQVANLLKEIDSINNTTTLFSNNKCFRSAYRYKSIDWLLSEITKQSTAIIDYYKKIDTIFSNLSDNKEIKIYYWTNINDSGSRNVLHSHNSGCLSGIYYIRSEDTGALRFLNPSNILGNCNPLSPFTRDFYFYPKDKDLIMWPSWIPHEVEPNFSNKKRINIAFDILLI